MKVEIRPEPPPGEREAIREALARLFSATDEAAPTAWWREGALGEGEHPLIHPSRTDDADDSYSASSKAWSTSQGAKPWRR